MQERDLKVAEFLLSTLPDNSGSIVVLKGAGKATWKVFSIHETQILEATGLTLKEACQSLKEKVDDRRRTSASDPVQPSPAGEDGA